MYQCMVNNEAGEDIKDTWLQVREIAPTFTSHPNDTTLIEGQPATIHCQATGAPKPTISWLRDGSQPVPDDYIQESGDLVFTQTQASDTGDYTCIADNGVGTINATARLTVYCKLVRLVSVNQSKCGIFMLLSAAPSQAPSTYTI